VVRDREAAKPSGVTQGPSDRRKIQIETRVARCKNLGFITVSPWL
jgi:hypothetical protein